jgi:hypothetical protein
MRRPVFVQQSDPVHANARYDVAHCFETGQRRSLGLEPEPRPGSSRRVILVAPSRRGCGTERHHDALGASTSTGSLESPLPLTAPTDSAHRVVRPSGCHRKGLFAALSRSRYSWKMGCARPCAPALGAQPYRDEARSGLREAQLAPGEAAEALEEFDEALSAYQAAARRAPFTTTWLRLGEMADRIGGRACPWPARSQSS